MAFLNFIRGRLTSKLTIPTFLLFIIMTIVATLVGKSFFKEMFSKDIYNDFDYNKSLIVKIINDNNQYLRSVNEIFSNDPAIKSYLTACDTLETDTCENLFKIIDLKKLTFSKNYNLYVFDKNIKLLLGSDNLQTDVVDFLKIRKGIDRSVTRVFTDADSTYIFQITPVYQNGDFLGFVVSSYSVGKILHNFSNYLKYDLVFVNKDKRIFFSTKTNVEIETIINELEKVSSHSLIGNVILAKYPLKIDETYVGDIVIFADFYKSSGEIWKFLTYLLLFSILALIVGGFIYYYGVKITVVDPIKEVKKSILVLANSDVPEKLKLRVKDEIGEIANALNRLIDNFRAITIYTNELGKGNFDVDDRNISQESVLGKALISLKENLKKAKHLQEEKQEEERIRHWIANGLAKFGNILRNYNDNEKETFDEIIKELVSYINVEEGALLVLRGDDDEEKYLEIVSTYAYGRLKYNDKKIPVGVGISGEVALEGLPVYLSDLPDDYPEITSGLGEAKPRYLYVVPLKLEEEIFGVIELASFNQIEEYKREFVEKLSENIASTLKNLEMNKKTKELLAMFREQSEELKAQEEEMKQNLEELQATQEDLMLKEKDFNTLSSAIDKTMIKIQTDKTGKITYVNENFEELTGYGEDIIGEDMKKIIPEKEDFWYRIISTEGILSEYITFITSEEDNVKVQTIVIPYKNQNGIIEKILFIGIKK